MMDSNVLEQFTVPLNIVVRACTREDLPNLEWFGLFSPHRQIFLQAFERHELGENMMLVAEANGFPIAQVWVDVAKKRTRDIGIIWALRVMPNLQNMGIGTRLITVAERIIQSSDLSIAEIGVEKENIDAKRLYERLGYRVVGEELDEWDVTTPEGTVLHYVSDEWTMQKKLAGERR